MAKVTYLNIPAGLEDTYWKALKPTDRFLFSRVVRNDSLISRKRRKGMSLKSMFPVVSPLWLALTDDDRTAWGLAGAVNKLTGWQLFLNDTIYRISNDISGLAVPSLFHQGFVGEIKIVSPATEILISQFHPASYYVQKQVPHKKGLYYPALISEGFGLPLTLEISFCSNLVSCGSNSSARFYAKIKNSWQAVDDEIELSIPLEFVAGWNTKTVTLSTLRGTVIGYNLYIEIIDLQGILFFDNIKATHNLTNWARDPMCKSIDNTYTKAFFQIPKNWIGEILPNGAEFDSVYPPD